MTRRYEIIYILDAALEEKEIDTKLDGFHKLLKTADVKQPVVDSVHWGKRTLAYSIKRHETGYYVVVNVETAPEALAEFERVLKLDPQLLRYLIVLHDGSLPQNAATEDDHAAEESNPEGRLRSDSSRVFDYKDERTLMRYTTDTGKIVPRRISGNTARQQRQLSTAIKRARIMALMPAARGRR